MKIVNLTSAAFATFSITIMLSVTFVPEVQAQTARIAKPVQAKPQVLQARKIDLTTRSGNV